MMTNILKSIGRIVLALIAVIMVSTYCLLYTGFGLNALLKFATHASNNSFVVLDAKGKAGSHVVLNDVIYNSSGMLIHIKSVNLYWQPAQLLKGKIYISYANLQNVDVKLLTQDKTTQSSSSWLRKIILQNIDVEQFHLYKQNKLVSNIERIITTAVDSNTNQFMVQLKQGILFGSYYYEPAYHWKVSAQGLNVNANYLLNGTSTQLSFLLTTEGDVTKHHQKVDFHLTNLTGSIDSYPVKGEIRLHDNDKLVTLNNVAVTVGNAIVKASGIAGKQWNVQWQVNVPSLTVFNKAMKGKILSNGSIVTKNKIPYMQAQLSLLQLMIGSLQIDTIKMSLSSQLNNMIQLNLIGHKLKYSDYELPDIKTNGEINFVNNTDTIHTHLLTTLSKTNNIVTDLDIKSENIKGNTHLNIQNLNQFVKLNKIKSLQGAVTGDIHLNGTLSQPDVTGSIQFKNGLFSIPQLNIHPHAIEMTATFLPNDIIGLKGSLTSGPGSVKFDGNLNLSKPDYPLALNITGSSLQVAATKEYNITASPQLKLEIQGENAVVSGELLLPILRITLENYNTVVTMPSEVEYTNIKQQTRYFKNLKIALQLELGNDARIDYENLHADLSGRIFVYALPGGMPTGRGALHIKNGTYDIYNKQFAIDNGRLIYVGNLLTNPGLDIRALLNSHTTSTNFLGYQYSTANDYMQLGVAIAGTLDNPVVSLFSNPPMSQDDVLSYIVFGQPRSQVSAVSALSLLGSVSSSLNVNGPVSSDPTSNNNNTVTSKMGFFNPVSAMNLALPLSKRVRIQTETNINEVGVDILYNYNSD